MCDVRAWLHQCWKTFALSGDIPFIKYNVSQKNDTALACYNFDVHQSILIILGRSVAKKVSCQTAL